MKINDVILAIEQRAPVCLAEEWDNVGLMLGDGEAECTGVAVSLDCTAETVRKAAENGCNLIVTHHPLIFRPLANLNYAGASARLIASLAEKGIAVYSAHTNLDASESGASAEIARKLGGTPRLEGCGCYADIDERSAAALAKDIARILGGTDVRVSSPDAVVKRVYIVSGAGGDDEGYAVARAGADALVSGEVKHHVFVRSAEEKFPVVEFSHYYSETICCDVLIDIIKSRFSELKVVDARNGCPYKTLEEL